LEKTTKKILVAPLNWGLGHATRCIPIINALIENGFQPILASDGAALALLKKEFPNIVALELPSYQIEYAKNGLFFKWKLLVNSPKMIAAIWNEKRIIKEWVQKYQLSGVISDNRLGVFSKKVPSVFITHQLNVITGNTTWMTSKLHQKIILRFKECWIPDVEETPNLTGKLGHLNNSKLNLKYIGPLSRLNKLEIPIRYQLLVVLSGPEPQRTLLEEILKKEVSRFAGKVVFIKGIIEEQQIVKKIGNTTFYNYMNAAELEKTFNESELVLCRSGYTTVMDLAKLEKKAYFIPTPGQYEQEYLAKKYKREGWVPYSKQEHFVIEKLSQINFYKGLKNLETNIDWKQLFLIFDCK
jgi:uncharacterized protein (TIGR00661 family)